MLAVLSLTTLLATYDPEIFFARSVNTPVGSLRMECLITATINAAHPTSVYHLN